MNVTKQKPIQAISYEFGKKNIVIWEAPNASFLPYAQKYLLSFLTVFIIHYTNVPGHNKLLTEIKTKRKPKQILQLQWIAWDMLLLITECMHGL